MSRRLLSFCRFAFVLVLGACTLAARPGHAAPTASPSVRDSLTGDAAAKFDEGSRLYRASDFAAARESFLAAFAKSGEPRILFNVAVCDKALGRYARAIATFRRSLATTDRPLPADYTQKTSEAIATLSRYVAFVTVEVDRAATTTVDGEKLQENPVPLETGTHTIVATKEGFETATKTIAVKAGESSRVEIVLEPARPGAVAAPGRGARLRVLTDRPDDTIRVDGNVAGKSGREIEVPAGEHVVVIERRGESVQSLDVVLRENELRDLRLTVPSPATDRDREGKDRKGGGLSPWWYVGGGTLLVGIAVVSVFLATRPTTFEGSAAGTLNPYVVPASSPFEVSR